MDFFVGAAALTVAYAGSGLALSWFLKRLGLLNLSSGAIAGTAGYVFALVFRWSNEISFAILAALASGAVAGAFLAALALRLRELEFAIASFAVQIVWVGVVANSTGWLGGPLGIAGVAAPPGSATLGAATAALLLATLLFAAVLVSGWYERRTALPAAAAVVARSTELADTLGLPTVGVITLVGIGFGAALGALGVFLATYTSFVGIQVFSIQLSITLLAVSFAAIGSPISALFGAVVLVGSPEMLRLVGYPDASIGFVKMTLVGIVVVLSVPTVLRPFLYETSNDE
jgi:branched-chain amino acid transport system permease protein